MLPHGFLGTRADVLMDVVFVSILLTPILIRLGIRRARSREWLRHRNFLATMLLVLLSAVLLFELDVRLSGGSGSLMKGSRYAGTFGLRALTLAHIAGNVVTFGLWLYLAVTSWRRFDQTLPGPFSARHRQLGTLIFAGSLYGVVTAIAMYVAGFIL